MKKIYIAGCGGMLGVAFYEKFSADFELKCTDININEDWLSFCDFRDLDNYRQDVFNFDPDYLFHLGAHTDLEYCEENPYDTYLTNTISVENAVFIANELNIPILYISTAGIFNGTMEIYDDWDTPDPQCHYARSKYAGELYVKENTSRHIICRAGWMMGGGPKKDKKFVHKILKQIKDGKTTLNIVTDKLGTPTYTLDFADNVKRLLESETWGLYNMVCEGATSRLEVAHELLEILGLSENIKINEVTSAFFADEYFAKRPESERLNNFKLKLRGLNTMRDWRVALREYLTTDYANYL
jgi:dTDP-4-dehydrorhamnose reductase